MQITEHVHAIKIPFTVNNGQGMKLDRFVYVYLIVNKDVVCLIDSGVSESQDIIYEYLENHGINPEQITMLVFTHSHPDHIGSAPSIQRKSMCEVFAHPDEKPWIEDVELQYSERPVPNFHSLTEGSIKVDRVLKNGDTLFVGDDLELKVIKTAGHSKGSISLYSANDKILISGDSVPLKGDLPIYDDIKASFESIELLRDMDIHILLSSWDNPKRDGEVTKTLDDASRYLINIHKNVVEVLNEKEIRSLTDEEFTRQVLRKIGLPENVANPIITRSFKSNEKWRDHSFK